MLTRESVAHRAIAAEIKTKKKTHDQKKIKRKIDFSDLRNPQKNSTPLFGEVPKFRTLTENKRTTESRRRRS